MGSRRSFLQRTLAGALGAWATVYCPSCVVRSDALELSGLSRHDGPPGAYYVLTIPQSGWWYLSGEHVFEKPYLSLCLVVNGKPHRVYDPFSGNGHRCFNLAIRLAAGDEVNLRMVDRSCYRPRRRWHPTWLDFKAIYSDSEWYNG